MKTPYLILCGALAAAVASAGCRPSQVEILPADRETLAAQEAQEEVEEPVGITPPTDPKLQPKFISARRARKSPVLKLTDFGGEQHKIQPGNEGAITLVVFWSMIFPVSPEWSRGAHKLDRGDIRMLLEDDALKGTGPAAAVHVRDLARKYSGLGVRAIGIVEKTIMHEMAPTFRRVYGISYPVYYDDFSALDDLGDAARVRAGKGVPCFFLIDRELRVRMFKRGFSHWIGPRWSKEERRIVETLAENAPEGQHLEDFLKRLLEEQP